VDEKTDSVGRFIANLSFGKLDIEVPSNPHSICSKIPDNTNHSTAARFVNDELKLLWPARIHEEMLNLCSDAAVYKLKAATPLKAFYPNLSNFGFPAHGLQRVVEQVRANISKVNTLISMAKKVFL
jgi:hypothetical protein